MEKYGALPWYARAARYGAPAVSAAVVLVGCTSAIAPSGNLGYAAGATTGGNSSETHGGLGESGLCKINVKAVGGKTLAVTIELPNVNPRLLGSSASGDFQVTANSLAEGLSWGSGNGTIPRRTTVDVKVRTDIPEDVTATGSVQFKGSPDGDFAYTCVKTYLPPYDVGNEG